MTPPNKRRVLGRGLSALIPDAEPPAQRSQQPAAPKEPAAQAQAQAPRAKDYFLAPIEEVYPSPEQPRRVFDETQLEELAASITAHGVIQPLVVREREGGDGYYLIAGERRWRASQRAGLREVPVVVQKVSPADAFERALVENLQRADLNPIEEAEAYHRLLSDDYGYTQEQVAARVGKDRATVANTVRLLKLPRPVRTMVEEGQLSMGHARALLSLDEGAAIEQAARKISGKGLSVRATESLVRKQKQGEEAESRPRPQKSASVRDLETRLTRTLGAQVAVHEDARGKGGRIEIKYADLDDLDRLLARLMP